MLVLTRKIDQRLLIDGGIEIKVLAVHGTRVRLGIEAPRQVGIRRAEIEIDTERGVPQTSGSAESGLSVDEFFREARAEFNLPESSVDPSQIADSIRTVGRF